MMCTCVGVYVCEGRGPALWSSSLTAVSCFRICKAPFQNCNIHTTHPLKVHSSIFFLYSWNCTTITTFTFRTFLLHPKETSDSLAVTPISPPPTHSQPQVCSVSVDFHLLDISGGWNHTIWGPCLSSFTWHSVLRVHPCCSLCQYFLLCYGCITVHHMEICGLSIPQLVGEHLGCVHFGLL